MMVRPMTVGSRPTAYRKWDRDEVEWGLALRDLIVDRAALRSGMRVLAVGSAHGEPGLAVAKAVGPTGHVTLFDLAPDLLAQAAERARDAGLTNVATRLGDAHALPFTDRSFDRLTSRLAAMYFVGHPVAFREALRVLEPGGMAVYVVWGPFDQPMFRDIVGVLFRYVEPPADEPDAPSPSVSPNRAVCRRPCERPASRTFGKSPRPWRQPSRARPSAGGSGCATPPRPSRPGYARWRRAIVRGRWPRSTTPSGLTSTATVSQFPSTSSWAGRRPIDEA